ncbi:MAG: NAD(P)/FAD-dependent oxidoreductase [Clostridia bacterium]|nr:NAD(P)/FAD-dependent oxidoreductase [Clostridia bacterium]
MMKVCVVGGGASGLVASLLIAQRGHEVVLLEKNEKLGKKIYITGKGRCNLTNAVTGNEFLQNIVTNPKFVMSSEVRFNSNDTMELFEDLGVPLKVERGDRVFPKSDKASDITKALERRLKLFNVDIRLNSEVKEILTEENKAVGVKLSSGEVINSDAVVVSTGGVSYPLTGSTGDGYKFASVTGHRIVEPVPALVAILLNDKDLKNLSGLSLKNVVLKGYEKKKEIYTTEVGEMLFTGNGVSGPLVLSMSSKINRIDPKNIKLYIDFKPGLGDFALFQRLERDIVELKAKQFSSLLERLLPKALVPIFAQRLGVLRSKKVSQLTAEERQKLCELLKGFPLSVDRLDDIERAVVTSGGVSVKDIKPKSMESKLVSKLYFIGEVLDIDAFTGGFNLQLAFSTAAACASDF